MKNANTKSKTVIKLVVVLGILLLGIVALYDFAPTPQQQEITIPFTR